MSADSPALSVVVCSIGRQTLAATVDSVRRAIDRAATPAETLVMWQGADKPPVLPDAARIVETFPIGIAYARNRGLEEARGRIVAYVDDDEVVDPLWAAGLLAAFERPPRPAGVFGVVASLDDRGFGYCRFDGNEDRVFAGARAVPWAVGTGGNMAFLREALIGVRGFNLSFGAGSVGRSAEETDVIARLLRGGHTLVWTPDMRVYHPTKTADERLASRFPYGYGVGRLVRRHRDALLAARYSKDLVSSAGRAIGRRDRRVVREAVATAHGFAEGLVRSVGGPPPARFLKRLPPDVGKQLNGREPAPLRFGYRPDPHVLYRAGDDLVLHLYVGRAESVRRALEERERIRAATGLRGIPALVHIAAQSDALWVLEERLPGEHPDPRRTSSWFPAAARWLVALGGASGPPLRETTWWTVHRGEAVAVAPNTIRPAVDAAFERLGDLPARHSHGDLSRKNLLVAGENVGAVDWETADTAALPGLDLLFLAITARHDIADARTLDRLAELSPEAQTLRAALHEVGIDDSRLRPTVLAALAVWAADEQLRLSRLGAYETTRPYGRLLARWGPAFAALDNRSSSGSVAGPGA